MAEPLMSSERRIPGLRRWLRLPRPVEHDVNEEIAFHLESRVHELVSKGCSPDAARRVAETEFGDIKASQRELAAVDRRRRRHERLERSMDAVMHDVHYATRSLRRAPVFTIAATLTLVIGVGACVAIFAIVNSVLLRPLPYGDPDRLVAAYHDFPPISLFHGGQSASTYFTYQRLAHTIDGIGTYDEDAVNISEPGRSSEPRRVTSAAISASLIPLLEVSPILGRTFTDAEDRLGGPPVMLISEGMWRASFGADPHVLDRSLSVDGSSRRIIGVMPERFRFPTAATQIWLPLGLDPVRLDARAFTHTGIVRLKPGVSVAVAQRDFAAVLPRVIELFPRFVPGISTQQIMDQVKPRPVLVPLREDVTGGIAATLWMVAASAALVLLVACGNVANLALVRADARQREIAVREALGAGRARVALHFLAESSIVSALAGGIGLGVAVLVTRWLVAAGPVEIPRLAEVRVDARTVLFALAVVAFVAVLCAAVPTLRVVRGDRSLADGNRGGTIGRAQHRLRAGLVVGQIALALVVLSTSGLLLRTFNRLHAIRPGFDPTHLATFWIALPRIHYRSDTAVVQFFADLTQRVRQLPEVKSVAVSSRLPLEPYGMNQNPLYPESDPTWTNKLPPLQLFTTVSGDYFATMGIPLLLGRTFDGMTAQLEGVAIVSKKAAAFFWKDTSGVAALGKRFRPLPNARLYTVIGVVGDARDTALAAEPSPTVYFPEVVAQDSVSKQFGSTMALIVRTAGEPASINAAVRRIVHDLDATLPTFDVKPMTAAFAESMAQLTFIIVVLGSAAVVTLLLGTVGLYGVLAYLVTLRRREIGMRIALGATPQTVAAATTQYGIALAGIGIVAGFVTFAFAGRFLRAFLFGVTASDPVTLVAAAGMLLAVAALASWVPARRVAQIDPAEVLRTE